MGSVIFRQGSISFKIAKTTTDCASEWILTAILIYSVPRVLLAFTITWIGSYLYSEPYILSTIISIADGILSTSHHTIAIEVFPIDWGNPSTGPW